MRLMLAFTALAVVVAGCVQPPADVSNQICADGQVVTGVTSDGQLVCQGIDWADLERVPAGFSDDLDADSIETLNCRNGQRLERIAGAWACVDGGLGSTEKITRVIYSGAFIDTEAELDWHVLAADVGSFVKTHGDTVLMTHWNGNAAVDAAGGIGKCVFQLRIDDLNSLGSISLTTVTGAAAIVGDTDGSSVPFQVSDLWTNVGAGAHDLSIWVRGSPIECFLNPGNFKHTIVIEEIAV